MYVCWAEWEGLQSAVHGIAHGIYILLVYFCFKKHLLKGRCILQGLLLIEVLGGLWRMLGGVVWEVFSAMEKCLELPVKASKLLRGYADAVEWSGHQ